MKYRLLLLSIAATALLNACMEEQYTGQFPIDSIAPAPVSNVRVENVRGGAILTYDIEGEMDVLYVQADFVRNGEQICQKASVYSDTLRIEGLGKGAPQNVTLTVVDRSQNMSQPVEVEINPLDGPIYEVMNTLQVYDDFGGIRLTWENPDESPIMLGVVAENDLKTEYNFAANFSSRIPKEKRNVRGFDDTPRSFGVYAHDRWGNFTDTCYFDRTPLLEQQLDKGLFRRWNPSEIPYIDGYDGVWSIEQLWDNRIDVPYGYASNNRKVTTLDFCFDMGTLAKVSRFVLNMRPEQNLCYSHAHPKTFAIYGSSSPNVGKDTNTWEFIGEFESYQPSGKGAGNATADDIQYANIEGEQFDVDGEAPPFRYIRFYGHDTWGASNELQIMEMTIYGQIIK